jgi:translocation and assembly module TamB
MTNSPNSGHQPETARRRRFLLRAGLATGGVLLAGAIAATLYIQNFIYEKLAPSVAESLTETFSRPVKLGGVERVSLTSLRLGASSLPPTDTDADRVQVEAIEVGFNLLELLWSRTLHLDVTLIRPDIFVDQDVEGQWIETQVKDEESDSFIKTELDEIRIQNGRLVLAASKQIRDEETGKLETIPDRILTSLEVQNVNGNTRRQSAHPV